MTRLVLLISTVALLALVALADEAPSPRSASTKTDAAKLRYEHAIKSAKEAYEKAVIAADKQYLAELDEVLRAAKASHNDDLARTIEAQKNAALAALQEHQSKAGADGSGASPTTAPAAIGLADRARMAAAKADLANIATAFEMFELDTGRKPTTQEGLQALVGPPKGLAGWNGPYLKAIRNDPWGNAYVYKYPGQRNANSFDLFSTGPGGKDASGEQFKLNNWTTLETQSR